MDIIYHVVDFRHPAIDSVDGARRRVIDSVLAHVQNEEVHAQQIIDSAGKYTLFFPYRINGKF
jgi:hypothetical protein